MVRHHQLQVGIADGESVADGVDRFAQPLLGHDGGGMGAVQVVQEAAVLALEHLGLGPGRMDDLPLLDDLVGQRAGMDGQLLVGGEQFARALFQQAFRRQPRPPFLRQSFHQVHAAPRRHPAARRRAVRHIRFSALPSRGKVNQDLMETDRVTLAAGRGA